MANRVLKEMGSAAVEDTGAAGDPAACSSSGSTHSQVSTLCCLPPGSQWQLVTKICSGPAVPEGTLGSPWL